MKRVPNKKYLFFLIVVLIIIGISIWFFAMSKRAFARIDENDLVILKPAPDSIQNPWDTSFPLYSNNGSFSYFFGEDGNLHIKKDGREFVVLPDGSILEKMADGSYRAVDEKTKSEILLGLQDEKESGNTTLSNYFAGGGENLDSQVNLLSLGKDDLEKIARKNGIDAKALQEYVDKLKGLDEEKLKGMNDEELRKLAEEMGIPYDVLKAYQDNLKNGKDSFSLEDLEGILADDEAKKKKIEKEKHEGLQALLDSLGITNITADDVLSSLESQGKSFEEFTNEIARDGAIKALKNLGYNIEEEKDLENAIKEEQKEENPFEKALNAWMNKDTSPNYSGLTNVLNGSGNYSLQNEQDSKKNFINSNRNGFEVLSTNKKNNMIVKGTLIKAVLINSINSDIPGEVYALVSDNVYDGFYQDNILIPKGSVLCGVYDSSISWGQNTIVISWNELRRPDGLIMRLNGYSSTDKMGFAGTAGSVDNHIGSIVGGSILASLIKYGASYSSSISDIEALSEAINEGSSSVSSISNKYLEKVINRQPTIKLFAGDKIIAMATDNIEVPLFSRY